MMYAKPYCWAPVLHPEECANTDPEYPCGVQASQFNWTTVTMKMATAVYVVLPYVCRVCVCVCVCVRVCVCMCVCTLVRIRHTCCECACVCVHVIKVANYMFAYGWVLGMTYHLLALFWLLKIPCNISTLCFKFCALFF